MKDCLTLEALEVWTRIGITEEERAAPQRLLVTARLWLKSAPAGKADDLSKTADYAPLVANIRGLLRSEHRTIEAVAEEIASVLLEVCPQTEVSVRKFPALSGLGSVELTIRRER